MEHYFSKKPESRLKIKLTRDVLRNKEIKFYTASGLFSTNKVDKGSELLINKSIIKDNDKILDLGCGYGIIGLSLKLSFPKIKIIFSDINERAIQTTKDNLKLHNVKAEVIQSDGFENINEKFDIILLNPPQTAGKQVCFKLIEDSKNYLEENGTLQLVARHNKGGKELSKKMLEVFKNVKETAKSSGYRIYLSRKA